MRQILADSINRMPEREKVVLTLYYYEGLTLAEISDISASPRAGCARSTPGCAQLRSRITAAERGPSSPSADRIREQSVGPR